MDPILIIGLCVLALLLGFCLINWWSDKRESRVGIGSLEDLDKMINEALEEGDSHTVGDHLDALDTLVREQQYNLNVLRLQANEMREQVNHLATVQMLVLNHLNLEHEVQPQQDRLVKKSKGRSA